MTTATLRLRRALTRLAPALRRLTLRNGHLASLTPVQAQAILFCGRTRPRLATVGHLARELGSSHATAVGIVDGLVRRGLLERRTNPDDRRVTLLMLTPQGKELFCQLEADNSVLERALASLPASEQERVAQALEAISAHLAAEGVFQLSAPCPGCCYFRPQADPASSRPHFCHYFRQPLSESEIHLDCPKHKPALLASVG